MGSKCAPKCLRCSLVQTRKIEPREETTTAKTACASLNICICAWSVQEDDKQRIGHRAGELLWRFSSMKEICHSKLTRVMTSAQPGYLDST